MNKTEIVQIFYSNFYIFLFVCEKYFFDHAKNHSFTKKYWIFCIFVLEFLTLEGKEIFYFVSSNRFSWSNCSSEFKIFYLFKEKNTRMAHRKIFYSSMWTIKLYLDKKSAKKKNKYLKTRQLKPLEAQSTGSKRKKMKVRLKEQSWTAEQIITREFPDWGSTR